MLEVGAEGRLAATRLSGDEHPLDARTGEVEAPLASPLQEIGGIGRSQHRRFRPQLLDRAHQPVGVARPDRNVAAADAVERGERRPRHERPGVVGRDDALAGCDARGGVASRRARDPVLQVAGGEGDVARRAGRATRRVDPHDLCACRTEMRAERIVSGSAGAQLVLLGQRESRDLREAACILRRPDPGRRQLVAVERRSLEEVGELSAVARVVEQRLAPPTAVPRPPARASGRPLLLPCSYVIASSALAAIRKPTGCSCSSARWASSPAVRARSGNRLRSVCREAEIEQDSRDRHRDVHRQRPAPHPCHRVAAARARAGRAGRSPHARRRARGSAPRAGRAACAPGGRSPAPCRPRRGSPAPSLRRRCRARRPRSRSPAHPRAAARTRSAVPRITGPQPRIPAATAPCSDPGSAASVIRAATFVGIIPCSAIATSSRSRK